MLDVVCDGKTSHQVRENRSAKLARDRKHQFERRLHREVPVRSKGGILEQCPQLRPQVWRHRGGLHGAEQIVATEAGKRPAGARVRHGEPLKYIAGGRQQDIAVQIGRRPNDNQG